MQYIPGTAGRRLSWLSPHDSEVEIDPEQDVDDKDGDEGLRNIRDASFSFPLQHDVDTQHDANA